jgi:hypothetical protein
METSAVVVNAGRDETTAADAIVTRGARIDFDNVTSSIIVKGGAAKVILSDVSSHVQPGRLTALMGVSVEQANVGNRRRLTLYPNSPLDRVRRAC